ncbi:MAG: PAS domain S-box protein [Anaerolineae bacterium]|nr:PAS domain S-box protein [Anaerolineae bacterium]
MAPILAVLASLLFFPIVRYIPLIFFVSAILITAWYGGFKAGFLSTILSVLLMDYYILEPRYAIFRNWDEFLIILAIIFLGTVISLIEESRLRTERALRASRDQLQVVLEGITDGVIAQTPKGQPIFANQAATDIIGHKSINDVLKTPLSQTRAKLGFYNAHGDVVPQSELPSTKAFSEGITSQMVMRWTYEDGSSDRWINLRSTPVFDDAGKIQMAISIFSDITEEKVSELQLMNAHERLAIILASIKSAVVSTDTEGRIDLMNPSAEKLTGWSQSEGLGRPFEEVVVLATEKPGETLSSPIRSVLRGENGSDHYTADSVLLLNKNGSTIFIEYNSVAVKDQFGSIIGGLITFRDISERIRSERERSQLTFLLAAQQKRLENILANIPGMVWESTTLPEGNQKMEFVNAYTEKLFGYLREEWLANPNFAQKIIHPEDAEQTRMQMTAFYESGKLTGSVQFRGIAADGRIVPIEATYSLLPDDKGTIVGTCGLMTDMSQRKADENALRQSALDLKRSNEQLEQFAYVASHDLQEPLRMIISYLQLLERRYKNNLDQDATEFIAYAVDGATRMKALINDLLAYSRVKTGEQNFKRFDTKLALDQAINNLQMSIDEEKAQITVENLPTVSGDEAQFVQLFQNLLSNAIKFHGTTPPEIAVKGERAGTEWKISVRDNGIGMEPQYLERIFVIFQRLHSKEQYPGTGIGLAICKKVVEHHGGRIWAESNPGLGTTFWFTIPIR